MTNLFKWQYEITLIQIHQQAHMHISFIWEKKREIICLRWLVH